MLRLSKHGAGFFNRLLAVETAATNGTKLACASSPPPDYRAHGGLSIFWRTM